MTINGIRKQFAVLNKNRKLVYFDNSASTLKPSIVIDKIVEYYEEYGVNVHRGLYALSEKATDEYEFAREKIANLINSKSEEIIFTSGATESLNGLAKSLSISGLLDESTSIVMSEMDHHSNILPWREYTKRIQYMETIDYNFSYTSIDFSNVNIISVPLITNVTGAKVNFEMLRKLAPKAIIILDASQAIAHEKIDVSTYNVDFILFSGHKMYGPTGIGVLWGKEVHLQKLKPFKLGGGMINFVSKNDSKDRKGPTKFEAGTPNIAGAIGLGAAADFIQSYGIDHIRDHEKEIFSYLRTELHKINGIRTFIPIDNFTNIISFEVENIHAHDVAQFLAGREICVRAGHHCAQILHQDVLKSASTVRVSIGIYNTFDEVDKLIDGLKDSIEFFRK